MFLLLTLNKYHIFFYCLCCGRRTNFTYSYSIIIADFIDKFEHCSGVFIVQSLNAFLYLIIVDFESSYSGVLIGNSEYVLWVLIEPSCLVL